MYYLSSFARPQGAKDKQKRKSRALDVASKTAIGAGVGAGIGAGVQASRVGYGISRLKQKYGKGTNYKQPFYNMESLRNWIKGTYYEKNPDYIYLNRPDKKFRKVVRQEMRKSLRNSLIESFKKPVLIGAGLGALGLGAYQLGKTAKKD